MNGSQLAKFSGETKELSEARNENEEFKQYLEYVPEDVRQTLLSMQQRLEDRHMTNRHRLERLQTQIADLQEKLNRIDERVNESEMVRKDLEEIALMEKYNAKLQENALRLNEDTGQLELTRTAQERKIYDKQEKIRVSNQQSIMLQAELEIQRKKLHQLLVARGQFYMARSVSEASLSNGIAFGGGSVKGSVRNLQNGALKNLQSDFISPNSSNMVPGGVLITQLNSQESISAQYALGQEFARVQHETLIQVRRNEERAHAIQRRASAFFDMKRILYESLDSFQRKVQHTTQKGLLPLSKSYSDINTPPAILAAKQQQMSQGNVHQAQNFVAPHLRSNLQDRSVRNILYDTIRNMILNKLSQQMHTQALEQDSILSQYNAQQSIASQIVPEQQDDEFLLSKSIVTHDGAVPQLNSSQIASAVPIHRTQYQHQQQNITVEQFKSFSPQQLMNLIVLRPEILKQMLATVELKEKAINLLLMRIKAMSLTKYQNTHYNSSMM